MSRHNRLTIYAASALLCAACCLPFARWTVDDAYITYRYARRLAEGRGMTFNDGEKVQGFSSPLHMLIIAGGAAAGFDPVVWGKIVGGAAAAAAVIGIIWAVEASASSLWLGLWAGACLATNTTFAMYSVLGLEDSLYVALLLWGVASLVADLRVVPDAPVR